MKLICSLVLLILIMQFSSDAFSAEVTARIVSIDRTLQGNKKDLVFLSSGQVVKVDSGNNNLRDYLFRSQLAGKWLKIQIDDLRQIENATETEAPFEDEPQEDKNFLSNNFTEDSTYKPSILKSVSQAQELFDQAPYKKKESQCYNKAHIWAYDWRIKSNVYSSKIWIFFTRKYIREYEFEWWFHVAPYVHVVIGDSVKERVMDKKYTKGPVKINDWSNIFMRNSAKCPVVTNYTDHADYPESAYCFLMKSSMYYYQPVDLEKLEQDGTVRTRWIYPEVKHAYQEAFDINI